MSYFSETLKRIMDKTNPPVQNTDLAEATGLSASQISRIVRGNQVFVDVQDFVNIAQRVSKDIQDHAELAKARALDSLHCGPPKYEPVPGAGRVEVRLTSNYSAMALAENNKMPLPAELEHAINYFRNLIANDRHAAQMFLHQATLMGMPPFVRKKITY